MLKWCGSKQEFCCSRLISLTLVITQTFLLLTSRSQNLFFFCLFSKTCQHPTGCVCTTFGTHIQVPYGRIGLSLGDDILFYKSLQLPILLNTSLTPTPPPHSTMTVVDQKQTFDPILFSLLLACSIMRITPPQYGMEKMGLSFPTIAFFPSCVFINCLRSFLLPWFIILKHVAVEGKH